jgi:hypothetical protein
MADADNTISEHTKALLWWNVGAVLAGIVLPSAPLVLSGAAVIVSVYGMRRHKIVPVSVALSVALAAVLLHMIRRAATKQTFMAWIDVLFLGTLALEGFLALRAVLEYRRLTEDFQKYYVRSGTPPVRKHIK